MKICKDCKKKKSSADFYGVQGECKECTKKRIKISSRNIIKICLICNKKFGTCSSEIKRRGGLTCSRKCFFIRLKQITKRDEESPKWKGDKAGKPALHDWIKRKRGKPRYCEHCKTTTAKLYDWANKSHEYKRDLTDWLRLCKKCHFKYDSGIRKMRYQKLLEAGTPCKFCLIKTTGKSGLCRKHLKLEWQKKKRKSLTTKKYIKN